MSKKQGTYALTRWTLILRDYSKIRQQVLGNGAVMQSSNLQLLGFNQTTLIRLKRQECNILLQGVNLPASIPVAPVPLPPVQVRYTPLLHHHSLALNISTTCLKVQQDKQWSRGSLQLWPNAQILSSLSAQGCQHRASCSLSIHLHLPLPLCLLSSAPALPVTVLCMYFRPHKPMHPNCKMLVFHFTSGWRRCGGRGQIRNKLFNIHPI